MMRRATGLGLALASFVAARALLHEGPKTSPVEIAERAVRPFVLPTLWRRLSDAGRRGEPGEAIAAGRLISSLLPRWTDGLVHVAWICALDLSAEEGTTAAALDRLQLAIGWLLEAAQSREIRGDHQAAADLWLAAATMLDARTDQSPALAAAYRTRVGDDPTVASDELIARAVAAVPDPALRMRHAFATARLISGAIRMGDLTRAQRTIPIALAALDRIDDDGARELASALRRLHPLVWYADHPSDLAELRSDPWLEDIGRSLTPDRKSVV